ncbi:hypothetical protein [Dietzia sp. PP-33]|uniref:hypothetical protein n=1 Tax=Dietzia sp. PP-33 TaxID=2957500 RepID=UPI0029A1B279|nr:hypothetical protein [Dietzia sp. PP-33]MDX2358935.1 hypothetical protein [Dietzia sp. PP-33]
MGKQQWGSQGKKRAAKRKRRADRTKRTRTPTNPTTTHLTIPIWAYPEAAEALAEHMPDMTTSQALDYLLTEPVGWQTDTGRISTIVPAEVVAETGETNATYIAALALLHELGLLAWDDTRRVHIQTIPEEP